jgi:tRNA(His) 5'-end guanylyltransferase
VVPELQKEGIIIYRELIVEPWRVMYKIENDTIISKFAGVMDDMANTIIQKQNDILC